MTNKEMLVIQMKFLIFFIKNGLKSPLLIKYSHHAFHIPTQLHPF